VFIDIVLYIASSIEKISLEQACSEISDLHGIEIKKQSLDGRFHQGALDFILLLLSEVVKNQLLAEIEPDFLNEFNRVRLIDSTKFNIPKNLMEIFKGFNGRGINSAGVSIQYEFDMKQGEIINLELFGATKSDSKYAEETVENIKANDLVIRDLGYYRTTTLRNIHLKDAFFISRLNAKADVYKENDAGELTKICFSELYNKMIATKNNELEIEVYLGKTKQLPVRLIVNLMPEEIYNKRVKKIDYYNKANGHKTTKEIKDRMRFNLFITNISADKMSAEKISILYKIRWQIELVFKCWKSHMGIDKLQKMKYERFTTILYAKLLLIIINNEIINNIRCKFYREKNKLLSMMKCIKSMREHSCLTREMISNPKSATNVLHWIEKKFKTNHWQDKRKKRVGLIEIMELFTSNSDNYAIFKKETRGNTCKA
jgi:IS4 transposase